MEDDRMELPHGFRFHPTDEELIMHYLLKKVLDKNFSAIAMGDVEFNKFEPWDLPWKAKMGENEWYFFCLRDKKYPTGVRRNRATTVGYWKATGKDKEIFQGKSLIGMKKTLVFYTGRAPKGEKTNWVMHEYRLEGKFSPQNLLLTAKNEWVICRVFEKSATGKKIHYSGLVRPNQVGNEIISVLPALKESSPYSVSESVQVSCFSNPIETQKIGHLNNYPFGFSSSEIGISLPNSFILNQVNSQLPCSGPIQDHAFLKGLMENYIPKTEVITVAQETGLSNDMNTDITSVISKIDSRRRLFDDYEGPSTSAGALEFNYVCNY